MGKQDLTILKTRLKICRQENENLVVENERQKATIKNLDDEIRRVKDENLKLMGRVGDLQEPKQKKSQNIAGWTVRKGRDGYFRAFRKINGKVRGVYVGKRITKETKPKLQNKEKMIRVEQLESE